MSRERFSYDVKCDDCGTSGTVDISENDYPFMRTIGRSVDNISEGFKAIEQGDLREKIACTGCGRIVR